MEPHSHNILVYYEDTDFTGVVYHANYLKFFERAREHLLGPERLVELYDTLGVGFVVHHAELNFKQGAKHGDELEIRTYPVIDSKFRIGFKQEVHRVSPNPSTSPLVFGRVDMVAVDKHNKLVPLPDVVVERFK